MPDREERVSEEERWSPHRKLRETRTQENWLLPISVSEDSSKKQEASEGQPVGREEGKNDDGLERVLGVMDFDKWVTETVYVRVSRDEPLQRNRKDKIRLEGEDGSFLSTATNLLVSLTDVEFLRDRSESHVYGSHRDCRSVAAKKSWRQ